MAQTALTVTVAKRNNYAPVIAADLKLNLATIDATNGNSYPMTGREILVISNPDTVSHTVTISSVADHLGRTADITTYAVPAGEIHTIIMDTLEGWISGGLLLMSGSSALVKVGVLRF